MITNANGLVSITSANAERLIARLFKDEGFRALPYDDATGLTVKAPKGNLTWLVGMNLDTEGTQELATLFLRYKLKQIELQLIKYPWYNGLCDVRKVVVLAMAFNLGVVGLLSFTTFINFLGEGAFEKAALDLASTAWAKQVGQRAKDYEKMIATGVLDD